MTVQAILNKLPKYKASGQNKWRAPCPVHEGKDLNMIISEDETGKVGMHCFVCNANGVEVVQALGLPMAELFPPDDGYSRPAITARMQSKCLEDQIFVSIYDEEAKNRSMTLIEKRQYRAAKARIEGFMLKKQTG